MGINQAILIGTVVGAPIVECQYSDGVVVSFDLKTVYPSVGRAPEQYKFDVHRVHAARGLADIVQSQFELGAVVFVEGRLRYRQAPASGTYVLASRAFRVDTERDLAALTGGPGPGQDADDQPIPVSVSHQPALAALFK